MDETSSSSSSSWFDLARDFANTAVNAGIQYEQTKQQNGYEIQKLKLQALGQDGFYTEGQPGVSSRGSVAGLSPNLLLLLGLGLVAVLVLKD